MSELKDALLVQVDEAMGLLDVLRNPAGFHQEIVDSALPHAIDTLKTLRKFIEGQPLSDPVVNVPGVVP